MKANKASGVRTALWAILLIILICALLLLGGLLIRAARILSEKIDLSLFSPESVSTPTKIFVQSGGEWVEWSEQRIVGERSVEYISLEEMPPSLPQAFIAIEDKRFFDHGGVDWYRTAAAAVNYIFRLDSSFGASTITQQLVKNITGRDEVSLERKLREISFALQLEDEMSKEEILELYLNIINLSQGCYGVGSAARRYFSKSVSDLTLLECAAIAAITNSPAYYDPITHPENNALRRDTILREMHAQGYITSTELEDNLGAELELCIDESTNAGVYSWYTEMLIDDVIADLQSELEIGRETASRLVFGGGLEIYACVDLEIQKIMDDYYTNPSNFTSGEGAQCSMIMIDPGTGDILGIIGGIGEKSANRVQSYATDTLRPPGSTIKPLSVYAPALERGLITYASVYDDVPVRFVSQNGEIVPWPRNANGVYHGLSTMSYAVSNSTNTVPVKILGELGLSHSFYFLRDKLHLDELIEQGKDASGNFITDMDYAALALGQLNYGVSLRAITSAYTVLADGGKYHSPRSYSAVKNRSGEVILEQKVSSERVISEGNAEIMTKLLSEVAWGGTADALSVKNKVAVACKTGTSQGNFDRWCIGYTPSLLCGVWYGYEYPREIPRSERDHFLRAFDSVLLRIYSKNIRSSETDAEFPESGELICCSYCADSGSIPTRACIEDARGSRVRMGYFVSGTQPKEYCTTHVSVDYDFVCGGVATVLTPRGHIKSVGMIRVEREFPIPLTVSDAQYVYAELPKGKMPSLSQNDAFFCSYDEEKKKYRGKSAGSTQFNRLSTAHLTPTDLVFYKDLLPARH